MAGLLLALISFTCKANSSRISDTTSVATYNKLVSRYRYDKPDSAVYFAQKGMETARRLKDLDGQAMMYNQLGMIDDNVGRYHDSQKKYQAALSLYTQTNNTKGMSAENIRLGVLQMRQGIHNKAVDYFLRALNISQKSGNLLGQMEANLTLGEVYMRQGKFDVALNYFHIAEGFNSRLPFSNLSLNLYNDYGTIFRELSRFDDAKKYLNKGIAASNVPQYHGLNITLVNTLASVYTKEGNKTKSIELQKAALIKSRQIHNYIRELLTLKGLADTYGKDNVKQALFYYQQAVELAQSKDDQREVIDNLDDIAGLYQYQKDYKLALEAKNRQYALADKYFYKEMSKQINSLQAAYELNQSKIKVQQLSFANKQQSLERKVILTVLIGAVILLIVGGFFFYKTKHLNGLLNKTNGSLQESNLVKDKLFSVLGHDLRSPFVSVINLLEFVDDEDVTADQRAELFGKLKETSAASLETLNNLLKWGEMQIKGVRLNQTEFAIKSIIDRNITMLGDMADTKSITIDNLVADDVVVFADADHFDFVVRNFIANAIKFSFENGVITISADKSTIDNQVNITVKDNGVGISPDQLEQIFNIQNISTKGTNNEQGTSLGLLLCKEFVEMNGGHIKVASQPGHGSAFSFSLNTLVVKTP